MAEGMGKSRARKKQVSGKSGARGKRAPDPMDNIKNLWRDAAANEAKASAGIAALMQAAEASVADSTPQPHPIVGRQARMKADADIVSVASAGDDFGNIRDRFEETARLKHTSPDKADAAFNDAFGQFVASVVRESLNDEFEEIVKSAIREEIKTHRAGG